MLGLDLLDSWREGGWLVDENERAQPFRLRALDQSIPESSMMRANQPPSLTMDGSSSEASWEYL